MAEWKQINGYPDYMISDEGEVISTARPVYSKRKKSVVIHKRNQTIKPAYVNGYYYVTIGRKSEGTRKTFKVHRLVADAFCEKRSGCNEVNHIDGNKTNNRACNLEWCTSSENQKHAYANGLSKTTKAKHESFMKNRKDNSVPLTVTAPSGLVKSYASMQAFADDLGVDRSVVSRAKKHGRTLYGYNFV